MNANAEQRARLAVIEQELARLQTRYELAMSAFKFDEASTLQQQITVLDAEFRSLVRSLPARFGAEEAPTSIVSAVGRPRRRRRARPQR